MSEESKAPHATVWDPVCPARLLILSDQAVRVGGDAVHDPPRVNYLWSHPGSSSCNKHEKSALIKIIQAHEYYHERLDKEVMAAAPSKVFSRKCREALRDCLLEWTEELEQSQADETVEKTEREKEFEENNMENLELLKMTFSAMHLSDVILPLLPTNSLATDYRDPFAMPGAASANFVRYLRSRHMEGADLVEDGIDEMLESTQPDQSGDGGLYWRFMETLVTRGLLEEAWKLLQRHSQYQSAIAFAQSSLKNNPGIVETMQQVLDDFHILREVLLRAPLPGGRNDFNDDALGVPQGEDEDMESDFYLDGLDVGPSDYTFWEVDTAGEDIGDYPLVFSPEAAIRRHENWKTFVQRQCRNKLHLSRRLPEIEKILSILAGDFSQVSFEGWPEKLCADILYRKPDCRPRDLSSLTRRAMKEFDAEDEPFAGTIVEIIAGNAGVAISTFYSLGAASGAALPTTLLSVLYNMFLEASIVLPEDAVYKTEFLTEAAFAIVSSLASNDSDVGIDLATRLLMPYTMQDDSSPEIVACLTEILEHYNPSSDSSARNILNRCEKLILQKNRRVLECCASIALCRYRFHREQSRPGAGVAWLFRGVKTEAMMIEKVEGGSCYKILAALCYAMAADILNTMSKGTELEGVIALTAQEMASEIEREDLSNGSDVKIRELGPVVVFMQVNGIFEAVKMGDRTLLPKCVVTCLARDDGSATTYAPLPLQAMLLEIACKLILDDFEEAQAAGGISNTCVFDKKGLSALMESLSLLEVHTDTMIDIVRTKEILLRGLSQAIIAENAMKRLFRDARGGWKPLGSVDVGSIRTASLSTHAQNVQEAVVQRMLDF